MWLAFVTRVRRRWFRLARVLAIAGLALMLIGAVLVTVFGRSWIAHAIVVAPNAGRRLGAKDDPSAEEGRKLGVDEHLRVDVGSSPPVSLSVWLIEPQQRPPRGTVVVLHGIRSDKVWFVGQARRIAAEGYRAVVPDLRGHGRSSGDWLSYGVREARDLVMVLDELDRRRLLTGGVGVVGTSYGGAVGIQLAGVDPRVRAVVAIAPFSSLHAVVPSYVRHYLPLVGRLVPEAFIERATEHAGVLGGFDTRAANPLEAIARTRANVLLIHGRADDHIPPSHSESLHRAAPSRSELVLVAAEDHFSITADRSGTIAGAGMRWLHEWLDGNESE